MSKTFLKRTVFVLIFCLMNSTHSLMGQSLSSDLMRVEKKSEDTAKVNALLSFYEKYFTNVDDSFTLGLKYIIDAYYLSVKLNYEKGIIKSSYNLGYNLITGKSMAKATEFFFICLKKSEEVGDFYMEGQALMGIGIVFYKQKKWKEALDYFEKSTVSCNKTEEKKSLRVLTYLKGLCYSELKQYLHAKELLTDAINLSLPNIQFAKTRDDSSHYYECIMGLAKVDYGLKDYEASYSKYDKCHSYYFIRNEKEPLELIHLGKADIFYAQHNLKSALEEALKAYEIGRSVTFTLNLDEITTLLSTIYYQLGNKEKAYQFLLENKQIKDTLNNQDTREKIAIQSSNYTLEKNRMKYEDEIEKNNKRKNIAILSASLFAIFMIVVIFAYSVLRKERRKSEDLLLNILPLETAEELKKYGKAIPKFHASTTIMFLDVMGFTTISSSMTPETLVNMIDFYFRKFDEIITNHGLEKIKTIGDAYMCAGGLHSREADHKHANDSIDAAIEIMKFVKDTSANMKATYGNAFSFRIGIHTGNVVSGVVGSKKYAYDIWGDTVNVAARMEQSSQPGQINISSDTYSQVEGKYKIEYRGKISAKHKGDLDMYFIKWEE